MIEPELRGAWRELEARLRPFIARRVRSPADVDDVLQEVFLRMQRGFDGLRDTSRFGPWVYQLTRSAIVDHHRSAARHPLATEAEAEAEALAAVGDGEHATTSALVLWVTPFVAMLPEPYREALTLVELEGLTQVEAAERLGISLSGMKSRVQRGRQMLRASFEACCHVALDARGGVIDFEPRTDGKLPCCD